MSRGKYFSLEEAHKEGQIKQFCKEHPSRADERFALHLKRNEASEKTRQECKAADEARILSLESAPGK